MNSPWPWLPPKSTEMLLMHCDDTAYTATPDTVMYKLVDAICGTTGAGGLVNEIFLARAAGAIETIFYNDLDYVFGNMHFLARAPEESYPYNPLVDMLNADQWSEIRVKDAWYRARIREYFIACGLGSTIEGVRRCVAAALTVDCDTYEVWRYRDNFGITQDLGRAPVTAGNELVIRPHKSSLDPSEIRLVRDMLSRFMSIDTIVTVSTNGLAVQVPVPIAAAASDSTYYEVQKVVTPTPLMSQLPPPELLAIDLLPTETWMYSGDATVAPYAAFNISQEYGYWYLAGGGSRSPINSVTYGTIDPSGPVKVTVFELSGTYSLTDGVPIGPTTDDWFSALDPTYFRWIRVPYPGGLFPMDNSVAQGVVALVNAINSIDGPFILAGYSQGAMVISNVYDEIRAGSLQHRRDDLLGGLAYGNPRREAHVTFPGCPDPGGHGISPHRLVNTEPLWWEFANPGDIIATTGDDLPGQDKSDIFDFLMGHYTGLLSLIIGLITNPIPNVIGLAQAILDAIHGVPFHALYMDPNFHPVPGDVRTPIQIGFDYISSLALPNLAALTAVTPTRTDQVTCYEVMEANAQTPSWFSTQLDSRIRYVRVPYPATQLPLQGAAISAGMEILATQINRNPGKFMLIGTGEGAVVTSNMYDQLRTGYMRHRNMDLVAAVAFGNPRREEGKIFPGGTDPGGRGISGTRLADTGSLWWEFANPGDLLCANGTDETGDWFSTMFDDIMVGYTGNMTTITTAHPDAPTPMFTVQAILNVLFAQGSPTSHLDYITATPIEGDGRTSFQIARDYLNTFAALATPYNPPPADPMRTYRPEQTFESVTSVAEYGPWKTYEIVDSPDNYPGGKFGKTPHTAPALNPDDTPYSFPWPSQQAYITAKSTQVEGMGGQADNFHYRLPIGQATVTRAAFLPEYSIAYTAPTQESTVSKSLTRMRPKTQAQTGWNQVFATSGAAPIGASATSGG